MRYLARLSDLAGTQLYGDASPLQSTQIDFFVDLAFGALTRKEVLPDIAAQLNLHLATRTFLVGRGFTAADLAVFTSVRSNGRWAQLNRNTKDFGALIRWFNFVDKLPQTQVAVVAAKKTESKGGDDASAADAESGGNFDIDLPGAEFGKVVTRFPPEPSGYLHIGHAKAALLNYIIATKYGGHVILRFDDTNPSKEKSEYVDNILTDLSTLGVEWKELTHTSQHFDHLLECGLKMLQLDKAYIDETPVDQVSIIVIMHRDHIG